MNAYFTTQYAKIKNLPFILKGNSAERKLRLTILISGISSILAGLYMVNLNFTIGERITAIFYCMTTVLGVYISASAFWNNINRHIYIITHSLLVSIIVICLFDNHHDFSKHSEYNYFIALTIGSALVLRQQAWYLKHVFPLICLLVYLFFVSTGTTWQTGHFQTNMAHISGFSIANGSVPVVALLLAVFTARGNYSETDLIKRELSRAIEGNQLQLYYQPQLDSNQALIGFEALLRWKHPAKGFISPEVFIPIAEKSGLIIDIGRWVMEQTLRQISVWERHHNLGDISFSINISPLQLMHRDFTRDTLLTLSQTKIQPERIKFEITETTFIYDQERIAEVIQRFSKLGIKWAIDDFGVGYSSLKSISDFAVDDIKIDKSLIMQVFKNESASLVVQKTIELSREMGLNVLAEGIENEEYFEYLKKMGCQLFQGFHFSRPLPATEALLWIQQHRHLDSRPGSAR